ncbi:hypothetical protein C8J56DRAFT_937052 [Mycena floridula]|nr:hypothetical protein C8J56DRAFT_937052 [Mycena floridula]
MLLSSLFNVLIISSTYITAVISAPVSASDSTPSIWGRAATVPKPGLRKASPKKVKPTGSTVARSNNCAMRKKKRGLQEYFTKTNAPATIDVQIGTQTFKLTKSGSQGNNAVVYQDAEGDFAKTPLQGNLQKEAEMTAKVGQLKAHGEDACTSTEWLITTAAKGKLFNKTSAFETAKKAGKDKCLELAEAAATLAVAKAKAIFDNGASKIFHGDLNAGNIFFDDQVTQVLTLIDWGSATIKQSFSALNAKGQATISFKALC